MTKHRPPFRQPANLLSYQLNLAIPAWLDTTSSLVSAAELAVCRSSTLSTAVRASVTSAAAAGADLHVSGTVTLC